MLTFLSERHNNVQCDGKNSRICYLLCNLFFSFLTVMILLLGFKNLVCLQFPVKSLKVISAAMQEPVN